MPRERSDLTNKERIAAPMVGDTVSSTVLRRVVIPAIYSLWKEHATRREAAQFLAQRPPQPAELVEAHA